MKNMGRNLSRYSEKVRRLWEGMNPCELCPRMCKVNRRAGEIGFCGTGDMAIVSSVGPHFGEESVLVGKGGSGTIFLAGCNLGCVFCQNYDISHFRHGQARTMEQIVEFMFDLNGHGCGNINFVTPTHVVPAVAGAIELARQRGLELPIVYNCGGYELVETLRLLEGYVDIYMPDMKFSDSAVAKELADAADYPEVAFAAVKEMHRQVGDLKVGANGVASRGLLVRHLVLPNKQAGSFKIMDFLAEEISPSTTINVMEQYRPCFKASSHPKINRRCTAEEIAKVREYAVSKGLNVLN